MRSLFGWVTAISDVTVLLKEIREELREIKLLYKRLVEKLMSIMLLLLFQILLIK